MGLRMGKIRKVSAENVKRRLGACVRMSAGGKVTIGFAAKPGASIPDGLEVMDVVEGGAKIICATVRGMMAASSIVTDEGIVPLDIIEGGITMCLQEKCA